MNTVIMRLAARAVTPVAVALSLYLLIRGHVSVGGGFPAAVVLGLAITLRYWALGPASIRRLLRLGAGNLIGLGLVLMLAAGALGWVWGGHFLETATLHLDLPAVGEVEVSSTLLFEIGVAALVVAVVMAVVQALGEAGE